MIRLENVVAGYKKKIILDDINMELERGINVVLGPNGAGKTTLFRTCAGIIEPYSGKVEIMGVNPFRDITIKKKVGYLSHYSGLSPSLNVIDNLRFIAKIHRIPKKDIDKKVRELMEKLSLSDFIYQKVSLLSRGQFQKVGIAGMLLTEPEVILLDEPLTGLDPNTVHDIKIVLQELRQKSIIIYSTHNLNEAYELADSIYFLKKGKLLNYGDINQLKKSRLNKKIFGFKFLNNSCNFLEKLGLTSIKSNEYWTISVEKDEEIFNIIKRCVEQNYKILEVREMMNPLEVLFIEDYGGISNVR